MERFVLFASPWWVNLMLLLPVIAFIAFRGKRLVLTKSQLFFSALFAMAFGFDEAAVESYLRAAVGFLPGYLGNLSDIAQHATSSYQQMQMFNSLPASLFAVESFRDPITMAMLVLVAVLSAKKLRERFALFIWMLAFWDILYYGGLWMITRWPGSLTTPGVLFLTTQWVAQMWFFYLIIILSILAVALNIKKSSVSEQD